MAQTKVALVTGAGKRRVGSIVADALAENGYALAIHYHKSKDDAMSAVARYQQRGVQALAAGADLTDERAVRALVEQTLRQFGRIDVLVNAAGVWHAKRLEDVTAADVRLHFETNTLATFVCTKEAGLAMVGQPEGGCIVTIGDWATERPYLDHAAYFPSKGAIPALTRVMAVELGTRNPAVRVNCILPGPVLFPPDLPEAEKRQATEATLVRREGRPENIAQTVLFFIQNDFVTGVCLPVDEEGRSTRRRAVDAAKGINYKDMPLPLRETTEQGGRQVWRLARHGCSHCPSSYRLTMAGATSSAVCPA